MKEKINFVVYTKINGKYVEQHSNDDPLYVYQRLSEDLIAKKINCCTYIRKITRTNLYNGYAQIAVNYDNNVKIIYTIKN